MRTSSSWLSRGSSWRRCSRSTRSAAADTKAPPFARRTLENHPAQSATGSCASASCRGRAFGARGNRSAVGGGAGSRARVPIRRSSGVGPPCLKLAELGRVEERLVPADLSRLHSEERCDARRPHRVRQIAVVDERRTIAHDQRARSRGPPCSSRRTRSVPA
jgi:hypothetical protein